MYLPTREIEKPTHVKASKQPKSIALFSLGSPRWSVSTPTVIAAIITANVIKFWNTWESISFSKKTASSYFFLILRCSRLLGCQSELETKRPFLLVRALPLRIPQVTVFHCLNSNVIHCQSSGLNWNFFWNHFSRSSFHCGVLTRAIYNYLSIACRILYHHASFESETSSQHSYSRCPWQSPLPSAKCFPGLQMLMLQHWRLRYSCVHPFRRYTFCTP